MNITDIKKDLYGFLEKNAQFYVTADKFSFVLDQMKKQTASKYPDMTPEQVEADFEQIKQADTTPSKSDMKFIANLWINDKDELMRGLTTLSDALTLFNRFKGTRMWGERSKDINSYKGETVAKTIENIDDAVADFRRGAQSTTLVKNEDEANVVTNEAEVVFEDAEWIVYIPKTWKANCVLGKNTSWCTAMTSTSTHWDSYEKGGSVLYDVISKSNQYLKFQLDNKTNQFKDRNDREIARFDWMLNDQELTDFITPLLTDRQKETVEKNKDFIEMDPQTKMQIIESGDEHKIIELIQNITLIPEEIDKVIELYA